MRTESTPQIDQQVELLKSKGILPGLPKARQMVMTEQMLPGISVHTTDALRRIFEANLDTTITDPNVRERIEDTTQIRLIRAVRSFPALDVYLTDGTLTQEDVGKQFGGFSQSDIALDFDLITRILDSQLESIGVKQRLKIGRQSENPGGHLRSEAKHTIPPTEIIPGATYRRLDNPNELYTVLFVGKEATGYERRGRVGGDLVTYRQEYDGQYPKGSVWTRTIENFAGTTRVDKTDVPTFTLVSLPAEPS